MSAYSAYEASSIDADGRLALDIVVGAEGPNTPASCPVPAR
jgi:hypothetical protein